MFKKLLKMLGLDSSEKQEQKSQYKCQSCGSSSEESGNCCGGDKEKVCSCGSGKFTKECCEN